MKLSRFWLFLWLAPFLLWAADPSFKRADVNQFDKLRATGTNVLLDVRTKKEFEAGHITGAKNIDIQSPDFAKQIANLDHGKVYLVNCAVGGRSAKACGIMAQAGFTNVYNLEGGIKAWEKAGKPIEK